LAGWALFWFLILGSLLGSALEAVGIPDPWRSLLVVGAVAAVFIPLIRAAVLEARGLRAEGIDLPSYPVTRKSLISVAVITGVLWIVFGVLVFIGKPVFPLVPIAGTAWLAFQAHRRRTRLRRSDPPEVPSG
jgi:hypothetical protein